MTQTSSFNSLIVLFDDTLLKPPQIICSKLCLPIPKTIYFSRCRHSRFQGRATMDFDLLQSTCFI